MHSFLIFRRVFNFKSKEILDRNSDFLFCLGEYKNTPLNSLSISLSKFIFLLCALIEIRNILFSLLILIENNIFKTFVS